MKEAADLNLSSQHQTHRQQLAAEAVHEAAHFLSDAAAAAVLALVSSHCKCQQQCFTTEMWIWGGTEQTPAHDPGPGDVVVPRGQGPLHSRRFVSSQAIIHSYIPINNSSGEISIISRNKWVVLADVPLAPHLLFHCVGSD